jgi:Regulator of G protein signaling domain
LPTSCNPHTHTTVSRPNLEFLAFLKREHCDENLLFLDWITRYTHISSVIPDPTTKPHGMSDQEFNRLIKEAVALKKHGLEKFVASDAPQEVPLPSKLKKEMLEMLQGSSLAPTPAFNASYDQILQNLKNDTFSKFSKEAKSSTLCA